MKKLLIAATLSATFIMSGAASAAPSLTTPETLSFNFTSLDASTTLGFTGFDSNLGTLHSVHFSWTLDKTLNNAVINASGAPITIGSPTPLTATSTTTFSVTGAAASFTHASALTTPAFSGSIRASTSLTDSIVVGTATAIGLSGASVFCDDGSCANPLSSADLATYIGGINLFNVAIANAGTQGGSVPSTVFSGNNGTASGSVSIVYDYTAAPVTTIPEPTSLALLGLGLVGLATASRRKKTA